MQFTFHMVSAWGHGAMGTEGHFHVVIIQVSVMCTFTETTGALHLLKCSFVSMYSYIVIVTHYLV